MTSELEKKYTPSHLSGTLMNFQHAGSKIRTASNCNSPFANKCTDICLGDPILLVRKANAFLS